MFIEHAFLFFYSLLDKNIEGAHGAVAALTHGVRILLRWRFEPQKKKEKEKNLTKKQKNKKNIIIWAHKRNFRSFLHKYTILNCSCKAIEGQQSVLRWNAEIA